MLSGSFTWGLVRMIKVNLKYDRSSASAGNPRVAVQQSTRRVLEEATVGAFERLFVELDVHATSGKHWPGDPNQASAPGEYPQKQTGELQSAIEFHPAGEFGYKLGFFGTEKQKYVELEFNDPEDGGRKPLGMLFEEAETYEWMRQSAEENT